ncbi:MAG: cytidine deaminase [Anaerolineae bacterium]|nr:cytidine deaminase [Anaerolineae bacterium]NIN96525.1 cytidine deaminase [Anaerolineae bacterium]NIQ79554.1 cytidine deaminase [Anaerolineae bacterium]
MDALEDLVDQGREAREKAYAPYSGFKVGAALRTKSGRVYCGSNVENAAYGLTICAERVAVFNAVSEGECEFEALAVVSENLAPPCGPCRQVLAEFGLDTQVVVADLGGRREVHLVSDLLPMAFTPALLPPRSSDSERDAS